MKAAFLKCAVDLYGVAGDVPRILAACASASLETGAPIMVHTNAKLQTGLPGARRADPSSASTRRDIVIAHAGDSDDLAYLRAIADTGASLGYDRFNMDFYASDSTRLSTLTSLLARGLRRSRAPRARRVVVLRRLPSATRCSLTRCSTTCTSRRTILPALLAAGVTQAQIDQMLIDNPRRFLGANQRRAPPADAGAVCWR